MPSHKQVIIQDKLELREVACVARDKAHVQLSPEVKKRILSSRGYVEKIIEKNQRVYGINTGFGALSEVTISREKLQELQHNIITSHAVGVGDPLSEDVVRAILLLKINTLSKGYSGVRLEIVEALVKMLNAGLHPVIPSKGSVGSSGDLAPLAHMSLPLVGLGEVEYQGKRLSGKEALVIVGLSPFKLQAKEGLALINGTQVTNAIALLALLDAEILAKTADLSAALSFEALCANREVFDKDIQRLKPYKGQADCAENMRKLLGTVTKKRVRLQDAYSLRAVPQVHGAVREALAFVRGVVEIETNAVTDNPLIFSEKKVVSGGNFHGETLAMACDLLAIAVAELANIAERRINRLIDKNISGLPAFLINNPGLNSGFMIPQYTAAALVSENKILAHPASVDSIPTSAQQEDHVSMATIAARKAEEIIFNAQHVISIELLCAAQGVDLGKAELTQATKKIKAEVRKRAAFLESDRLMIKDMQGVFESVQSGSLLSAVEKEIGALK